MEASLLLVHILCLVVSILLILAILRIFSIDKTLKQVLSAIRKADENRREEFNATVEE